MDNFDLRKYLAEGRLLKEEMELQFFNNDEEVALIANSGEYEAEIEDGKVSFSVVYEDEDDRDGMEFDEDNWKSILGPNHAFVEVASKIPTEVEAIDDYVMITVNLEDLKGIASLAEGKLLKESSDIYPFQASPEKKSLYDKIANELEGTLSMVANKLDIPPSDIRISLDSLWNEENKTSGMVVQVKADDTEWKKAWAGNNLIMQTINGEGVTISADDFLGVKIYGNKNPKVRAIYSKSLDLDLESLIAVENAEIANSLSPEELTLIAPNTPIIITGK